MYVILFYDIQNRELKDKDNSRRIRKAVEKYLPRVQYSVYEGELRPSEFKALEGQLKKACEDELDSIVIYVLESQRYTKRLVIGQDKNRPLFS
jgi:CRISPR-associated protein Cas2